MAAVHVTNDTFEAEVLKSDIPVLVDFFADWCGPCKMIAPMVEEAAETYKGKLKVCKVNVDEASDVAANYGIMSIPTLIMFKGGKKVDQAVGAMQKGQLDTFIANTVG